MKRLTVHLSNALVKRVPNNSNVVLVKDEFIKNARVTCVHDLSLHRKENKEVLLLRLLCHSSQRIGNRVAT